jgi:hypothetical protein
LRTPCCPLAPLDLALRLASMKGVPAYPLRSNPGTPFLDQDKTCFVQERQAQSVGGSERAAGWWQDESYNKKDEGRGKGRTGGRAGCGGGGLLMVAGRLVAGRGELRGGGWRVAASERAWGTLGVSGRKRRG